MAKHDRNSIGKWIVFSHLNHDFFKIIELLEITRISVNAKTISPLNLENMAQRGEVPLLFYVQNFLDAQSIISVSRAISTICKKYKKYLKRDNCYIQTRRFYHIQDIFLIIFLIIN